MASRRPGRRSGRACCTGLAPGEEASLITLDRPADCPECGAAGLVSRDLCEICFADVGELSWPGGTADLSPAVPPAHGSVWRQAAAAPLDPIALQRRDRGVTGDRCSGRSSSGGGGITSGEGMPEGRVASADSPGAVPG